MNPHPAANHMYTSRLNGKNKSSAPSPASITTTITTNNNNNWLLLPRLVLFWPFPLTAACHHMNNSQHAKLILSKLGTETFVKECKGTKHFMKVQRSKSYEATKCEDTRKKTNKATE